jgi:replicative DNA helicase
MAESFKPSAELTKELAEMIHPITADLEGYKNQLGDGSTELRGIATGINEIDKLIGGLDRFVLLAGRSGAGKTTLALQLGLGALEQGTPVIIYSLEMSRYEIITKLVQTIARGLFTNTIELRGNDPKLEAEYKQLLEQSLQRLSRVGERLFIKDASGGIPKLLPPSTDDYKDKRPTVYDDVEQVKQLTGKDRVLVIIDSIQDIVSTSNANQVQAEVEAVNQITTLQQKTNATVLCTSQKNKGSINSKDSYGDVLGSVSLIHKPNTVIELVTIKEMIAKKLGDKSDKDQRERLERVAADIEQDAKGGKVTPMILNVIKGRYTGTDYLPLKYYGAYGYFDAGIDSNYNDVYDLFNH